MFSRLHRHRHAADRSASSPTEEAATPSWEGRCIAGRYQVEQLLGRGGMGAVYRARQLPLGRPVAIKVLAGVAAGRPELGARFEREALALSRLDHPHCIALLDYGLTDEHQRYLVMPLLEGTELRAMMGQPIAPARAVALVRQILLGLEHAHRRGVVHRDLKPENVFVTTGDHGEEVVKLVDFGLAKLLEDSDDRPGLTRAGLVFGTPMYMSPEQAAGGLIDEGTDLYAAGVLLYELLRGKPPFDTRDVVMLLRQQMLAPVPPLPEAVPADLRRVVARLLEKERAHRFATARQAREALERCVLEGLPACPEASAATERPAASWIAGSDVGGAALSQATQPTRELPPLAPAAAEAPSSAGTSAFRGPSDPVAAPSFAAPAASRVGAPPFPPAVAPAASWAGAPPFPPAVAPAASWAGAPPSPPAVALASSRVGAPAFPPPVARPGSAETPLRPESVGWGTPAWSSTITRGSDLRMTLDIERPEPRRPERRVWAPAGIAALFALAFVSWSAALRPSEAPRTDVISRAGDVVVPTLATAPAQATVPASAPPVTGPEPAPEATPHPEASPAPAPPPVEAAPAEPAAEVATAPKPRTSTKRATPSSRPQPERVATARPAAKVTPAQPVRPAETTRPTTSLPDVDTSEPARVLRAQRPARTTTETPNKTSLLPSLS